MTATRNLDWMIGRKITNVSVVENRVMIWVGDGIFVEFETSAHAGPIHKFLAVDQYKDNEDWTPEGEGKG